MSVDPLHEKIVPVNGKLFIVPIALLGVGFTTAANANELGPLPATSRCQRDLSCRSVFAVSLRCFEDGDYDSALEGFQSGYESAEDPILLVHIGRSLSKLGHYQAALDRYRQYQRTVTAPEPIPNEEVKQEILEIEAKLFPESLALLRSRLNAKAPRKGTPLYRRGWFWGLTSVSSVGLALGLGLGLTLPNIPVSHQTVEWNH